MSEQQKRTAAAEQHVSGGQPSVMPETIDLVELAFRLLDSWKMILCAALALSLAMGVYTVFGITPMYEATATIYVLSQNDSAINLSDLQLGTALTQDYIKVFSMWEVHEEVISNLNLPYSYREMEEMLSVANTTNTRMLDITISSPDPQAAAAIANEYAKVASQYIADTMATNKPNIMSVALAPANPVSPSLARNIVMGFLLGVVLSCAYVTLNAVMDDKYKTAEEIRKYTDLPTLAIVPIENAKNEKKSRRHA